MRRPGGLAPLVLTGGVLLVLVLAGRGSAYGEQVFNVNANSTNNTLPLSANESAAQSFTPTTSFVLYNVTVRIQNVGVKSDSVNLTVQTDAGGVPSGTPIAWSVQSQSGSSWLDFPMTPRPQLTRGQTYWIVATNPMSVGNGYGWFHSNTDAVPGEARQNFGGSWLVSTVTDLMYLTYGLAAAPSLAIGMTANRTTADPGATFAYT